ncbi:MAG: 50S ribosomal protein L17, partial [Kineosporiaceae bacterium]
APVAAAPAAAASVVDAPEPEPAAEGPYGPDSAEPLDGGAAPDGFTVKGNRDSMKYHLPGGRWYDATVAEVWFRDEESARAAGFAKAGTSAKAADGDD